MCLGRAKVHARFVMCGGISQYNKAQASGPTKILNVVTMRIRMQGFLVTDHRDAFPEARAALSRWRADGKLRSSETVLKGGLDVAEQGLVDIFKGVNTGKLLVEVKSPDESPAKL